jgi:hypothetical protein
MPQKPNHPPRAEPTQERAKHNRPNHIGQHVALIVARALSKQGAQHGVVAVEGGHVGKAASGGG